MTTLSALKATIADDLNRSDLTSQIASAITDSIWHYKNTRFYWNETRGSTFATVAAQSRYTSSDDADIPLWFDIDKVFVNDGTREIELEQYDPVQMEYLLGQASPTQGVPYAYAYYDRSFWLYPVPDDAYTVRPLGAIEKAAPATDGEANNVWMVEAYELLRCHAKALLAVHVLKDPDMLTVMRGPRPDMEPPGGAEGVALKKLQSATGKRVSTGRILATQF